MARKSFTVDDVLAMLCNTDDDDESVHGDNRGHMPWSR